VADTGSGISAEEISKVFDPFFTTKRTGTGLGLSVTYGIIQEHGGTVDVQSRPGDGTTFVISFPTTTPAAP
jgi:signal transduction histidine kinase